MLDLPRLNGIRLSARPRVQRWIGHAVLTPNYRLPPRVRIAFEGEPPPEPVIFAMNHTDRYNYWPFQYQLWRCYERFTATWVKGKYYENPAVGKFMELTNNIPTVSRGYLITRDVISTMDRRPTDEEYEACRAAVAAVAKGERYDLDELRQRVPAAILDQRRNMLGRTFDPAHEDYPHAVDRLFRTMMDRFVALNAEAFDKGLDLLVFPQGTRSVRLSRGHVGLAQIALHFRRTIVPVGCNGSDRVYPGASPWGRPGRIVYRFGSPIRYEDMKAFHAPQNFEPFTPEAEEAYRDRFQGLVDQVMEEINTLLDERYRWDESRDSRGVSGTARFV